MNLQASAFRQQSPVQHFARTRLLPGYQEQIGTGQAAYCRRRYSWLQHDQLSKGQAVPACGNAAWFFVYEGRTYLEEVPEAGPAQDEWHKYHRVATHRDGKVVDACDFQFKTTVHSN